MSQRSVAALALTLLCVKYWPSRAAPNTHPGPDDLETYDLNSEMDWESVDFHTYGESYDYDDLDEEIQVGTVASSESETAPPLANEPPSGYKEEVTLPPQLTPLSAPVTLDFKGPGLFGPETAQGMPVCLLCVCMGGSVYCDDANLEHIPALPRNTTHFYARFNNIRHLKNTDFINLNMLKGIDLTGNHISGMDEDVFRNLPQLQQLVLRDNRLQALPELPASMVNIDVRNNRLVNGGIHPEGFKDLSQLQFLYLSNNKLDYIPAPLPESLRALHMQNNNIQTLDEDTFCNRHDRNYIRHNLEDIRLDANPLDINKFAGAYVCLPRLPVGGN